MQKLNVKAWTLSFGFSCAVYMLLIGWLSAFGWGVRLVEIISSFYIGFAPTFFGGIIGAVWGFIDGAIGGLIIALIYNLIAKRK